MSDLVRVHHNYLRRYFLSNCCTKEMKSHSKSTLKIRQEIFQTALNEWISCEMGLESVFEQTGTHSDDDEIYIMTLEQFFESFKWIPDSVNNLVVI